MRGRISTYSNEYRKLLWLRNSLINVLNGPTSIRLKNILVGTDGVSLRERGKGIGI